MTSEIFCFYTEQCRKISLNKGFPNAWLFIGKLCQLLPNHGSKGCVDCRIGIEFRNWSTLSMHK